MDSCGGPHHCTYDEYRGCGHRLANCHLNGTRHWAPQMRARIITPDPSRRLSMLTDGTCPVCVADQQEALRKGLPAGALG